MFFKPNEKKKQLFEDHFCTSVRPLQHSFHPVVGRVLAGVLAIGLVSPLGYLAWVYVEVRSLLHCVPEP